MDPVESYAIHNCIKRHFAMQAAATLEKAHLRACVGT